MHTSKEKALILMTKTQTKLFKNYTKSMRGFTFSLNVLLIKFLFNLYCTIAVLFQNLK